MRCISALDEDPEGLAPLVLATAAFTRGFCAALAVDEPTAGFVPETEAPTFFVRLAVAPLAVFEAVGEVCVALVPPFDLELSAPPWANPVGAAAIFRPLVGGGGALGSASAG